ncbi:MAG: hypothetical protein AAFO95_15720 [Cyanobacteria bacterium J06600_6]
MTDIYELLICLGSGFMLLILLSGLIGNNLIFIEVPLLGKVPFGLLIALAISLYGCFGLVLLGLGKLILADFSLTSSLRSCLGIFATITSYYFGKVTMEMFVETPYQPFYERAIGLIAKIRYVPLPNDRPGDALICDRQEKTTQIVTIYLADWVQEKELKINDSVLIIDYLTLKKAFVVIKAGGVDELTWQTSFRQ